MRIGIAAYRILSVLSFILLVPVVWFATDGRWWEAGTALAAIVLISVCQALMLRCQHCGARPGLWILGFWTLMLNYELYLADALFLRQCPRCQKSLSEAKATGAV